jgi:DHA1 family tetracycline resistance protein-like MFS transporter
MDKVPRKHSIVSGIGWSSALFDGVASSMVLPFLPFMVLQLGGSITSATAIVAVFNLMSFIGSPVLGGLADRVGRRATLILSLVMSAIAYLGLLLTASLPLLFLFRALSGLAAGRGAVLRAMVTDALPPEKHVSSLSWLATAAAVGAVAGPVFGGLTGLASPSPATQFQLVAAGAFATSTTLIVATVLGLPSSRPKVAAPSDPLSADGKRQIRARLLPIFALGAIAAYGQGVALSATAVVAFERFAWSGANLAWLLALMAALIGVARIVALPRLVAHLGDYGALALCLSLAALSGIGIGFASSEASFVIATVIYGLSGGLATMLPHAMVSVASKPDQRGYAFGWLQAAMSLAATLSTFASGPAYEKLGAWTPFAAAAAILASGALGALRVARSGRFGGNDVAIHDGRQPRPNP